MARKVDDAANFVFVQLIEQEPGIYDKRYQDYARQDKIDLVWERLSHEAKESHVNIHELRRL
jgi:inosine/xanthosine triphosphate pyrophosphatase family protein